MSNSPFDLASERKRLAHVLEHAWLLPPGEVARVRPGDLGAVKEWLPLEPDHPLRVLSPQEKANPGLFLLRLMRNPDFFPFTCQAILGVEILPFQHVILKELWTRPFPMLLASRGASKSFTLALYVMLRLLLSQGCKAAVVGAAFRQSKVIFDYMEAIWAGAPVLRDLCGTGRNRANRDQGPRRAVDRLEMTIGDSIGIALPIGDGSRIRGQRAGYVIADEKASIAEEVFQNVIRGFAAVSANPVQNVKNLARVEILRRLGMWSAEDEALDRQSQKGNQVVVAGTAFYDFNHFCKDWKLYHAIIESRGDRRKLMEIFQGEIPRDFDWRDFSILRLPYELLPRGFMDDRMVSQARATMTSANFQMEYSTVFSRDSEGFFRRSLIDSCVVGRPGKPIVHQEKEVLFSASLLGEPGIPHVIGVDPAIISDNFSIVVLALYPTHRRVVHCWTIRKAIFELKKKRGLVDEHDYYAYCARKIRNLMLPFPTVRIGMDSQGGGYAIEQSFHEEKNLLPGEMLIWRVPDPPGTSSPKEEDGYPGLHILEMINFASQDWMNRANHGLRHDLETRTLLFPQFRPGALVDAHLADQEEGRILIEGDEVVPLYDTLEDCVVEIEELKDELASIVVSQTPSGRDHWDVPKLTVAQGKTIRLRKDRYTALLVANAVARDLQTVLPSSAPLATGGFASHYVRSQGASSSNPGSLLYSGPQWFVEGAAACSPHYGAVRRG